MPNDLMFQLSESVIDARLRQELEAQVRHPTDEYTEEKVAVLYQQMLFQNKYTFPPDFCFNL